MKNFILLITIFMISTSRNAQSQFGFECGFEELTGYFNSSVYGSSFTGLTKPIRTDISGDSASSSDAFFPVIIVFIQFKDDVNDWQWPTNQAPIYLDSLIAESKSYNSDWWDAYDENTEQFSDYWLEVSRGKFHVTGRAFSVVLDGFANDYTSDQEINLEIWSKIRNQGLTNWSPFDKWRDTLINGQIKFYFESDGYVDMIYKIHKNNAGPLWDKRGYAHLTYNPGDFSHVTVDDSNQIKVGNGFRGKGSGVTVSFSARKFHNMLALQHEHGHCLYANGHITYGKVSYGPGGDGFFSPYEMILLKYQSADTVNFAAQSNYYLADYSARSSSNGEILRVPIQGEECFLITNRSNVSKWDKIMLGDTIQIMGTYDYSGDYGKGIYINHIKSTGIFFPSGDQHVQDLECADGVWHWSYKGQMQRYSWDAGFCYNANSWPYYLRDSVSYDNDSGWSTISADARSYSKTIWAGIGKNDGCPMGTDRVFTNSEEIYENEEVLGDRYDAWNVGYNEIFSPYSSPNTKTMSNSSSGIYIWLYSNSGSGPTSSAAFKIYKAGEGGYTDSSILQITPPSKPMGLVVDYHPETENIMRLILTWNHNMEPDMLNTSNNKKKYKIWRATSTSMSVVPTNYTLHNIVEIDSGTAPSYIDTTIYAVGSGWPGIGNTAEYPVRYKIQAVDKYQDTSVRSDFDMGIGLIPNVGCPLCTEGPDSFISDTEIPREFKLYSNYPNPFNPVTNIKFDLPKDVQVSIKIYDIVGREVKTLVNEFKTAGRYSVTFSGSDFASGVYYYKIKAGEFEQVRKMILLK